MTFASKVFLSEFELRDGNKTKRRAAPRAPELAQTPSCVRYAGVLGADH